MMKLLRIENAAGQCRSLSLEKSVISLPVDGNCSYQLLGIESEGLRLFRQHTHLHIESDGELVAILQDFYQQDGDGGLLLTEGELFSFATIDFESEEAQAAAEEPIEQTNTDIGGFIGQQKPVWTQEQGFAYSWLALVEQRMRAER